MKNKNPKFLLISRCIAFLLILFIQIPAFAQDTKPVAAPMSQESFMMMVLLIAVIIVAILVLIVSIQMLSVMQAVLFEKENPKEARESIFMQYWKQLDRKWTNAVPLEKEHTMLLDHNYDGIRELNNHLPPWWVYLFYITIIFAVVYLFNYHVFNLQPLPSKEYALEMETAAKEVALYKKMFANNIDETNVKITTETAELAAGREVFLKECKACHGEKGEGGTGPNLTDEFWIHGGDIKNIFKTIKVGVQEKGMIPWEKKLKPDVMRNVSSYILTLQGTNPPNAKAPQGEKFDMKKMEN